MRQAGKLTTEENALRLVDYLLTQGIKARSDHGQDGWAIWIYEENDMPRGRELLAEFEQDPDHPRYSNAASQARALRDSAVREARERGGNVVDMRERWSASVGRRAPITLALVLASVVIFLWMRRDTGGELHAALRISDHVASQSLPCWGLEQIARGQIWRLVTPIFMHFTPVHLLFNMFMLYQLGTLVEARRASWRFAGLVLLIAVASNLAQFFVSGPNFGGMSGVVYGLFGYCWIKSMTDPGAGLVIHPNTVFLMIAWLFLGMTGTVGPIANTAHGVGLASGGVAAILPVIFRRRR